MLYCLDQQVHLGLYTQSFSPYRLALAFQTLTYKRDLRQLWPCAGFHQMCFLCDTATYFWSQASA